MSNKIFEEDIPAPKQEAPKDAADSGDQSSDKKVRQAVYDIRYRARREEVDIRHAYTQYMANSGLTNQEAALVKEKLFGKGDAEAQAESLAMESVSIAMSKVFGEAKKFSDLSTQRKPGEKKKPKKKREGFIFDASQPPSKRVKEELQLEDKKTKKKPTEKYKIRVTHKDDEEGKKTYVRYGDRDTINSLRGNEDVQSVEMTAHGEPTEDKKKGGKSPAIKKVSKKKSPKIDKDKDVKSEGVLGALAGGVLGSGIAGPAGAVAGAALGSKVNVIGDGKKKKKKKPLNIADPYGNVAKARKEEFIADSAPVSPPSSKKITGEKVNNKKLIKVYPQDGSDPQIGSIKSSHNLEGNLVSEKFGTFIKRLREDSEYGYDTWGNSRNPEDVKKRKAKEDAEGGEDPRSMYTKWNLAKNKLRAMGLKMSYDLEGDQLIENAVEYFYEQGIDDEGIDLIIEEVGLDDFTEFVLDPVENLVEEDIGTLSGRDYEKVREKNKAKKINKTTGGKLRKSNVRTRKKIEADAAASKAKPSEPTKSKKPKIGAPAYTTKVTSPAKKAETKKKVVASVKKVKSTQPTKTATKKDGIKDGLRAKISSAVKKGVQRHKKATGDLKKKISSSGVAKGAKEFASGVKSGVKTAVKAAKDVHSITQVNKKKTVNMQSYELEGELIDETIGTVVKQAGKIAVRQGIKAGGKKGGYAVKKAGKLAGEAAKEVAIDAGKGALKGAKQRASKAGEDFVTNVGKPQHMRNESLTTAAPLAKAASYKKSEKPGTAEKVGRVVGGIGGSIGGGLAGTAVAAPSGPGAIAGGVAGGVAGDAVGTRVGGSIGKTIDKKLKKEAYKSETTIIREILSGKDTVDEGRVGAAIGGGAGAAVGKKVGATGGATGGALVGAALGGPIGAAAGGAIGGAVGSKAGSAVGGGAGAAAGSAAGSAIRGKKAKNLGRTAAAGAVGGAVGGAKGAAVGGLVAGGEKVKKEDYRQILSNVDEAKAAKKAVTGESVVHEDIADILARLEKKRISKGGNPDESPLGKKTGRAMKAKQDEVRKKAGVKEHHEKDADGNPIPHTVDEAKVDTVKGLDDEGKEDARNYRKYGTKHSQHMQAVRRRSEHRVARNVKKKRGHKEVNVETGKVGKEIGEEKRPFPDEKVSKKLSSLDDKMRSKEYGFKRSTEKNRSMKISMIRDAVKRGEDPRKDTQGGAFAKRGNPDHDHRANFSDNRRKRTVKKAGV